MGMITVALCGIGAFVLAVLGAAAANQLAQEFRGWTPWLTNKLIERAVMKLPNAMQPRFREEWTSFIADTPGQVGQIVRALGLSKAANTVAVERASGHSFSRLERFSSRFFGLAAWGFFLPMFVCRWLQLLRLLAILEEEAAFMQRQVTRYATGAAVLKWNDWREALLRVAEGLSQVAKEFFIRIRRS